MPFLVCFIKKKKKGKKIIKLKQASLHPNRVVFQYALHINFYPIEIKSTISFWQLKKQEANCKKKDFFSMYFILTLFLIYCISFFSSPSCCWNVVRWWGGGSGGVRETEEHNRNRPTSAFITAYRSGSGGVCVCVGGGVGEGGGAEFSGQRSEPKLKEK